MVKLGLRARLFLSHTIVMVVGITTLVLVGKFYSPRLFMFHLAQLEGIGFNLSIIRSQLVAGFDYAWSRGAFWSVIVGGGAAGGLSLWVSRRIVEPLVQMEQITQDYAMGQLDARMSTTEIPELNRLSVSFNKMAAELAGVEQRRRELVGDLSHELRTPLTVVQGYLEGMADGTITPSPEVYQQLANETARLQRLVNDLQELSKAEAGYLPLHPRPIDLQPLLTAMVQQFQDQVFEDEPQLVLDCAANLPLVLADPERVNQILVNLLGNALRYTPHGNITVRACPERTLVWITVEDTGYGIASEDLPHVFERFWRSRRSRDHHPGGTGIGLAISKRLVELQGGTITAESQLGQGSVFRFSIPVAC